MRISMVASAISTARRSVLYSILAAVLVVLALVTERVVFEVAFEAAAEANRHAAELSQRLLLEDERLTMSATMAAETGEKRWIERYEDHIPAMDQAIADAAALAAPDVLQRFLQETKVSNDRLVEMERRSFEAVAQGNPAEARTILNSEVYARQKGILVSGTFRFLRGIARVAGENLEAVRRQGALILAVILVTGCAGIFALWRRINRTLSASEACHSDAEERLRYMALHDELTGLLNRRAFMEEVSHLLRVSGTNAPATVGIAMIDIDHFKDVNDTLGHHVGDRLICEVAQRLRHALPPDALLARFGGDELAVAVQVTHEKDIRGLIKAVEARFGPQFSMENRELHVTASAGVAVAPLHGDNPVDLLRLADIALYKAKTDGRGRTRIFNPEMDATLRERKRLEGDLRQSIGGENISLHYQPQMSSDGTRVTGVEALVRWKHPELGDIGPDIFIPVAEQTGLILPLGEWILRRAFLDAARWPELMVAVNLSPKQFKQPGFVQVVKRLVSETGVDPNRIELEITENLLLEENERLHLTLSEFRAMGFKIVLDDFGTGYSSLSYLRKFCFNKIKIDRTFIKSIETSPEAAQIIYSVVNLGRALRMTVNAEGVETREQHRFLQSAGCQQLQGYLFSKPGRADAIDAFIRRTTESNEPQMDKLDRMTSVA